MRTNFVWVDAATLQNATLTNGHIAKVLHLKITGVLIKIRVKQVPVQNQIRLKI